MNLHGVGIMHARPMNLHVEEHVLRWADLVKGKIYLFLPLCKPW